MNFDLSAEYSGYTQEELKRIVYNPESYTPASIIAAIDVLELKYPGWNVLLTTAAGGELSPVTVMEEGQDLLDGLEEAPAALDKIAVTTFWGGLTGLVLMIGYKFFAVIYFYWFSPMTADMPVDLRVSAASHVLPACVLLAGIAYLWYKRLPLAWNLFYLCCLYQLATELPELVIINNRLEGRWLTGIGLQIIMTIIPEAVGIPLLLIGAARPDLAAGFRVSEQNRKIMVAGGIVAALGYFVFRVYAIISTLQVSPF